MKQQDKELIGIIPVVIVLYVGIAFLLEWLLLPWALRVASDDEANLIVMTTFGCLAVPVALVAMRWLARNDHGIPPTPPPSV